MKSNVVIHVPHSSLFLPPEFFDRVLVSREDILKENVFITDYLVDKFLPDNSFNVFKAIVSRLYCDVERFKDNEKEPMSKRGMGVIYELDSNGRRFIRVDDDYKMEVIKKYYDKHHEKLDNLVSGILEINEKCYIIDLHSFADLFVERVLNLKNNPDICIGYDEEFCDMNLVQETINHFENFGYSVNINYPYSGSLVPNKVYESKDSRVVSIMIEINKRVYLDDNTRLNNEKYLRLKRCMDEYYVLFSEYINKDTHSLVLK